MAKKSPIETMIDAFGGPSATTRALGLSAPNVVMMWRLRRSVPAEYVLEIERLTGVSRHELRPDVFGKAERAA